MNETQNKEPTSLSKSGAAFLEARGLDPELCEKLGLTSGPGRDGREWLTIPYERNGVRVNRKFRQIESKKFIQDKGGEQILWRLDCLSDEGLNDQPIIITEGELDAVAAIQAGYWRSVSVPGGAPSEAMRGEARSSGKYAPVASAIPLMESCKRIVIASDNDAPGTAMLADLCMLLGAARCQFVRYPVGCKDLNDVLREHGEAGVRDCIDNAKWVRVAGVHKLDDLPPLPPMEMWWPEVHQPINDLIPIGAGQVSAWTGIPGHGKSSLLNAIVWSLARRDGINIAHGTFESTPQRDYLDDATGWLNGSPAWRCNPDQRADARAFVNKHITFLMADGYLGPGVEEFFDASLEWFFEAARTAVVRDNCRIVVLDPWSQIDHAIGITESETRYIQRSIRRAKTFARTFDVHVAIVAHPTKMRRLDDGEYAMPEGYEISGSAHWFNGVDLGVTSHRAPPLIAETDEKNETTGDWIPDPRSNRVLIRVWKKKNHRIMGKPGDAYASFDSDTNRYSAAEHWEERTPVKRYAQPTNRGDDD